MPYTEFARYYDKIYRAQGKDYEREACRLHRLIQQYKQSSGNRLLDVGCGTGEHLRYLRSFYRVQGVDISAEMLARAKEKLSDVPLHQGDMRTFRLNTQFDVIVSLFGTIGYAETLSGLQEAVQNMVRHVRPGGVVLIEPWLEPGQIEDGRTHVVVSEEENEKVVRIGLTRIQGRLSEISFHFVIASAEGIRHFEEQHRLGLFTREEYKHIMQKCGLKVHFDKVGLSGRGMYVGQLPRP